MHKNIVSAHTEAKKKKTYYLIIWLIQVDSIRISIAVTEYVKGEDLPCTFRLCGEYSVEGTHCTPMRGVAISLHHCAA